MTERRYDSDEVAEIFERAASESASGGRPATSLPGTGLTLAELQEIGREVGLPPARVAEAAAALEVAGTAQPPRRMLGVPISAGRTVPLPRAPTDLEWERLVGELRETFHANGRVTVHGTSRIWSNGNLRVAIEPAEAGYRLRMSTHRGDAPALLLGSSALLLLGLAMLVAILVQGTGGESLFSPLVLALLGAAGLGSGVVRLPRWAETRDEQMAAIATRTRAMLQSPPEPLGKP